MIILATIFIMAAVIWSLLIIVMVLEKGHLYLGSNLLLLSRRPFITRPEYVHRYCGTCGSQEVIEWEIHSYDTNTGKPRQYKWRLNCPTCDNGSFFFSGGVVDEYQYVNREWGVIPNMLLYKSFEERLESVFKNLEDKSS